MTEIFELAKFDTYREDNRREVKSASGGLPQSLWETYSAMANTYGGVIICGVKEREDGSWFTTGLKDDKKVLKNLWDQVNDKKKVSVNLLTDSKVETYTINGDTIIVIHVPSTDREEKPVYINGDMFKGTYKRNNEGDYRCTEQEVRAMLRDQTRLTMDMKPIDNESIIELNRESINSYRTWFETKHFDHAWAKLPMDEFLVVIGAARKLDDGTIHPTRAGLLMFGKEYRIEYEYPSYFLDYREHTDPTVRWTDRIQSQSPDWSGNVFDFYTIVSRKIVQLLKVPFKLVDTVRMENTPVHDAVREALVNCLVNADFYLPRGVVVEGYPDKIIFRNPGTIIVGKKQMLRGGDSEPRNANIMKMFNLIGLGEHAGSGVPDIFSIWNSSGYDDPIVEEFFGDDAPSKTIVTLPLTEKNIFSPLFDERAKNGAKNGAKSSKVKDRVKIIFELIQNNPSIKNAELAAITGSSKHQIESSIKTLKEAGKIHRENGNRKGKWIID